MSVKMFFKLICFQALLSFTAHGLVIVENGSARAQIIIPENANPVEVLAAKEMKNFVGRATGAELPVVTPGTASPEKGKILIGRAAGKQSVAPNSFIIKSAPKELILAGGDTSGSLNDAKTATGTLFAVYEFLEKELGVLWLWPDEQYGVVVRRKDRIETADYERKIDPPFENVRIRKLPLAWTRRSARACSTEVRFPGRSGHAFVDWAARYAKTNPDFFALAKSGRNARPGSSMCVANPAFQDEIIRLWVEARTRNPGVRIDINCCENDTSGACICERCKAWDPPGAPEGDVSERYAKFYNAVYEKAKRIDPSVRVYGYAYKNYVNAPETIRLPQNIMISIVPSPSFPYNRKARKEIPGNIEKWGKSGCSLIYRPNLLDGYAMPEDISTDYYTEFQVMRNARMRSIDIDGPNLSFATQGPFLYILQRLLVKPDASLEELKNEYYSAFGPAAGHVRDYWEYWNRYALDNAELFHEVPKKYNPLRHSMFFGFHYAFYAHRLFPEEVFPPAEKFLDEARKAAKDSPDDLKRVEFLKAGLDHARLCAATCAIFADEKSTTQQRLDALAKVRAFRAQYLPRWAAWLEGFVMNGRNEQVAWTFSAFDPNTMIELPVEWKLALDPQNSGERLGYSRTSFDDSSWQRIKTDRFLEYQGIKDGYINAWYRLSLTIPEKYIGKRAILHLGAVDESCSLWINGEMAGKFTFDPAVNPDSWKNPMEFDITEFIPENGKITIALKVVNNQGRGGLWRPSQIRFFNEDDMKILIDAKTFSPEDRSARTFGKQLSYVDGMIRISGAAKKTFGKIYLDKLKKPGGKKLEITFDYRDSRKHSLEFVVLEQDISKKPLRQTPIKLPFSKEWKTFRKSIEVLPETGRLDIAVNNNMKPEEFAEFKKILLELSPQLAAPRRETENQ